MHWRGGEAVRLLLEYKPPRKPRQDTAKSSSLRKRRIIGGISRKAAHKAYSITNQNITFPRPILHPNIMKCIWSSLQNPDHKLISINLRFSHERDTCYVSRSFTPQQHRRPGDTHCYRRLLWWPNQVSPPSGICFSSQNPPVLQR